MPGKVNYFIGNDPIKWTTNVPIYGSVAIREAYPGTDVVYHLNSGRLQYDFVVAPNADPKKIVMRYDNAKSVHVDKGGRLVIMLDRGKIFHDAPFIYQEYGAERRAVEGGFVLKGGKNVGFTLGEHDRSKPLVIDPVVLQLEISLGLSSFYGGMREDQFRDVATDSTGIVLAGLSDSLNYPTHNPLQGSRADRLDAVVVKLNTQGNQVLWATYLGGSLDDAATAVDIAPNGNVYVVGMTASSNFPTMNPLQMANAGGGFDNFVTGITPNGQQLVESTYLGGNGLEFFPHMRINANSLIYITGQTSSTNYLVTANAVQPNNAGAEDGYLTALKIAPLRLFYSTYYGGSGADTGNTIQVSETAGKTAYIAGSTSSTNMPVTNSAIQPNLRGVEDMFIAAFNLVLEVRNEFASYLGAAGGATTAVAMALLFGVDLFGGPPTDRLVIAGMTSSSNFPQHNSLQPTYGGGAFDGVVVLLNFQHRARGDVNGDGCVDDIDLASVLEAFGNGC